MILQSSNTIDKYNDTTSNISRVTVLMNSISSAVPLPHEVAMLTNVVSKKTVSDVRFLIIRSTNCSRMATSITLQTKQYNRFKLNKTQTTAYKLYTQH